MASFDIDLIACDSATWTPITAPRDCDQIWLRYDATDYKIRDAANSPSKQDTVKATVQFVIGIPRYLGINTPRFRDGQILAYVQLVSGSGSVVRTVI